MRMTVPSALRRSAWSSDRHGRAREGLRAGGHKLVRPKVAALLFPLEPGQAEDEVVAEQQRLRIVGERDHAGTAGFQSHRSLVREFGHVFSASERA